MKNSILIFIILILAVSCKKETVSIKQSKKKNLSISINFPDTVYVNKGFDGTINYKNDLDTLTKTLNTFNPLRTIVYTFLKTDNINYSDKDLKKIVTDTFYTDSNRVIPFYVKFESSGIHYLDGLITDEVLIDNGGKNSKGELMDRIVTNEFRITKKVVVIDKSNVSEKSSR